MVKPPRRAAGARPAVLAVTVTVPEGAPASLSTANLTTTGVPGGEGSGLSELMVVRGRATTVTVGCSAMVTPRDGRERLGFPPGRA
jgi:hypothetical protein